MLCSLLPKGRWMNSVCWVGGVLHDTGCSASAPADIAFLQGRKAAVGYSLSRFNHLLQSVSSSTSCLWTDSSFMEISPTPAVLSVNFTIWLLGYLAEKSCVRSVYCRELRTHPCGELVLSVMVEDEMPWILTDCGKSSPLCPHQLLLLWIPAS